jgi:hypothetical protein
MRTIISKTWFLVFFVVLSFSFAPVRAEQIKIGLVGYVESIDDPCNLLENSVHQGDPITGFYIYDTSTPDSNPLTTVGDYWHTSTPYGIYLNAGEFVFQTDPLHVDFLVEICNNQGLSEFDGYLLRSYNNLQLSNDIPVNHISWVLQDWTGRALSSTALTTDPPNLSKYLSGFGLRIEGDKYFDYTIVADVTSVYLIPEPATLILLAMGTLVLNRRNFKKD